MKYEVAMSIMTCIEAPILYDYDIEPLDHPDKVKPSLLPDHTI